MRGIKLRAVFASLVFSALLSAPVFADRFQSTNFTIDAGVTGNSVGGAQASTNYALTSSGGESVIGNGSGGSYKLGEGYVSQLQESLQLIMQSGGVELYYPFDEGQGLVAHNYNDSEVLLEAVGTPTWSTGKIGGGITTSSGNAFRSVSTSPLSLTTFQACSWAQIASTGTNPTVAAQADSTVSTNGMWSLGFQTGGTQPRGQVRLSGTLYTVTGSAAGLNTWVHMCLSFNGTTVSLIQNGVTVSSQSITTSYASPSTRLTVGSRSGGEYLDGSVDEVKIYSFAQGLARIKNEYDAQNAGIPAALTINAVTPGVSQQLLTEMTIQSDAFDYGISVMQDHNLQKGADTIAPVSGTIASPAVWSEGTTKGLGFTIVTITPGAEPSEWVNGTAYAALPGTATQFLSRQRSDSTRVFVVMRLRLDVAASQPSGDYQNTATWSGTVIP